MFQGNQRQHRSGAMSGRQTYKPLSPLGPPPGMHLMRTPAGSGDLGAGVDTPIAARPPLTAQEIAARERERVQAGIDERQRLVAEGLTRTQALARNREVADLKAEVARLRAAQAPGSSANQELTNPPSPAREVIPALVAPVLPTAPTASEAGTISAESLQEYVTAMTVYAAELAAYERTTAAALAEAKLREHQAELAIQSRPDPPRRDERAIPRHPAPPKSSGQAQQGTWVDLSGERERDEDEEEQEDDYDDKDDHDREYAYLDTSGPAGANLRGPSVIDRRLHEAEQLLRQLALTLVPWDLRRKTTVGMFGTSSGQLPGPSLERLSNMLLAKLKDGNTRAVGVPIFVPSGEVGTLHLAPAYPAALAPEPMRHYASRIVDGYLTLSELQHGPDVLPCTKAAIRVFFESHVQRLEEVGGLTSEENGALIVKYIQLQGQILSHVGSYLESGESDKARDDQWIYRAALVLHYVISVFNTIGIDALGLDGRQAWPTADEIVELADLWDERYKPLLREDRDRRIEHLTWNRLRAAAIFIGLCCVSCGKPGQSASSCFECAAPKVSRGRDASFDKDFAAAKAKDPTLTTEAFKAKRTVPKTAAVKPKTEEQFFTALLTSQKAVAVPVCLA